MCMLFLQQKSGSLKRSSRLKPVVCPPAAFISTGYGAPDFGLSHMDFVKRKVGSLPEGAWVGSATKNDGELSAVNSFTFYRNQLPGPEATQRAVFKKSC